MNEALILLIVLAPIAASVLSYMIGTVSKQMRDYFVMAVAALEFAMVLVLAVYMRGTSIMLPDIAGMGLHFKADGFRCIYAVVAAFMWLCTLVFSGEYFGHYRNRNRYYLFQLITLGAMQGVLLSADLYTTFIFFEIMSFTSYVWVAQDERAESLRAAATYLAVAVIGGMVLLMGIFILYNEVGTLEISKLYKACRAVEDRRMLYISAGCMLFGFGAKAGMFPLHIWLPKAHPVAPAPASALLSGMLTKAGIYGILVISTQMLYGDENWGMVILSLALVTMFLGALLAVFSTDIKRTMACSSVSQIGFILTGVAMQCLLGEEGSLAVRGTFLHMMNHSLIKLVLFMVAGVVYMNLHSLDMNEIRGFGRNKPFLKLVFLMGALGIGGFPLWNGYISKTLIHESIVEYSSSGFFTFAEWVFLISGGLTVAYMAKLFFAIFVERNSDAERQSRYDNMTGYINTASRISLGAAAIVLPVLGFTPSLTMEPLAALAGKFMRMEGEIHIPHYFHWDCIKGALISIAIGAVVYVLIIRIFLIKRDENRKSYYANLWPSWLDLEEVVYRPVLLKVIPFVGVFFSRVADSFLDTIIVLLRKTIYRDRKIPYRTGELPHLYDAVGGGLDAIFTKLQILNAQQSYRWKMRKHALKRQENLSLIRISISYGLLIAGVALALVLLYIMR